jgi:hypothetical protein
LARPRFVDCATAPGAALIDSEGVLCAAPLDPDERAKIAAPRGTVVRIVAGVARVVELAQIDPSEWIDLAAMPLAEVEPLGAPPAPPSLVFDAPTVVTRESLGGIGAPPSEIEQVASALRGSGDQSKLSTSWLERLFGWIVLGLARNHEDERSTTVTRRAERAPGWLGRFWSRAVAFATRAFLQTSLGRFFGRQQARYLAHLHELFQAGDLKEALRHAIPLSRGIGGQSTPALGVPRPRASLSLSLASQRAGSTLFLGGDVFGSLHTLYRNAFERLERKGEIEQAAFVLADLLQSSSEAVAFLERHGRLRLAAELAEARELPAGIVVRQWFLAKDRARAIRIAVRERAFADAVARLERGHAGEAHQLRLLWADRLAEQGDFTAAVDVVWPVPDARGLAREWVARGWENGGPTAMCLIPRLLELDPGAFARVREHAVEVLGDVGPEAANERAALLTTLAAANPTPALAALARPALRSQLREAFVSGAADDGEGLRRRLLRLANDPALRTDLPPLPKHKAPQPSFHSPWSVRAGDAGATAIRDCARLPNGSFLIALGELGIRLLRPDGRVAATFDEPAYRLVVSDRGDRALALAPRGESWRIARINLATRERRLWGQTRLRGFANDFDGERWFVVDENNAVVALDACEPELTATWRVDKLPGAPVAVVRRSSLLSFVTSGEAPELWTYELPSLTLRKRLTVMAALDYLASAAGDLVLRADVAGPCHWVARGKEPIELSTESPAAPVGLWRSGAIIATTGITTGDGVRLHCFFGAQLIGTVDLGDATSVAVRALDDVATFSDDRGRLLLLHIPTGRVLRNIRVQI